jgi:hypothetical protein
MKTEKQKAYNRAWRLAHKEQISAYNKVCYANNKEKHMARAKEYRLAHKKEVSIYNKEYRLSHLTILVKKNKSYCISNKNKINASRRARYSEYPDNARASNRKHKSLKNGVGHSPCTDSYIFERDGWICGICGRKINKQLKWPKPYSKSIDHIVPLCKGGIDAPINLQAAHLRCNTSKNAGSGGQLRLIG